MDKNSIIDEIAMCNSILEKFKEEMADCKKDYDTLKSLESQDGDNPQFKKAAKAVKERHDDLTLSIKLIKNRLEKLQEDLKNA
jgi:DNA anti-recombination protein RmuC